MHLLFLEHPPCPHLRIFALNCLLTWNALPLYALRVCSFTSSNSLLQCLLLQVFVQMFPFQNLSDSKIALTPIPGSLPSVIVFSIVLFII